jgi:hypothetical protein
MISPRARYPESSGRHQVLLENDSEVALPIVASAYHKTRLCDCSRSAKKKPSQPKRMPAIQITVIMGVPLGEEDGLARTTAVRLATDVCH